VDIHEQYIKRCLQLAKNGLGTTYPNPLVGSVIVYENKIIGEGWHLKSGSAHAEVNAINSVKNKSLLKKATIYVSLEPCSHFGKTPPCSDLIISNDIPNVVIGTKDPFIEVSGKGIAKLIEAGKNVTVGILEKECNELNKRFFTYHVKKRPYIILKWAESSDGFIAPVKSKDDERKPIWITNQYSRQIVHKWRTEEQGILIGTNTAIEDNPRLDARDWKGNNPTRIVIDRNFKISKESYIFDNKIKTIVITDKEMISENEHVFYAKINFDLDITSQICDLLYKSKIQSVIIEGGRQTLESFINSNLWDEARVFKSDSILKNGIKAPNLPKTKQERVTIYDNELLIFRNYD
jgi:diaminohydroxyphosphoribosylaminopyrimidine deaminase/5-amino-6-(5-phosphoribosylamino)uracil reductase